MDTTTRKNFFLEGLCCVNCAGKIERDVGRLAGVSSANVNFASKTLTMEISVHENVLNLISQANSIVKQHDPDITMNEKEIPQPAKRSIYLTGLSCADCARKIETKIGGMDGVKSASIDFISQKLTIEALNRKDLSGLLRQAARIAQEIEPGIQISYSSKQDV